MAEPTAGTIDLYSNFVVENKITDTVNSLLDVNSLMTLDTTLTTDAGLTKKVHKYTYSGTVEQLAKGAKNSKYGSIDMEETDYTVKRYQQSYKFNDIDVMTDPTIQDVFADGAAKAMANEIRTEYFTELAKISNHVDVTTALTYDAVVDALQEIGVENEDNLFLIMGGDGKTVYATKKDAVKFFVKREGTVEQDRDIETKDNLVVYERHGLIALVDDTESCIINFNKAGA